MTPVSKIDISENTLRNRGRVLDILLSDKTCRRNIIWATDSYAKLGKAFAPTKPITREQITGDNGKRIQPRAAKSKEEQKNRTKDKAEVFTPLKIVKQMNMAINWAGKNWPTDSTNWIDYISELRLEITCGEAPFIVSRYDSTKITREVLPIKKRVGFLDYKLRLVGQFAKDKKEWYKYAEIALKSSYGYEWQGDNLLIARENILMTMDDFYKDFCKNKLVLKSKHALTDEQLEYFAKIIAWNIWQMDGLKHTVPLSGEPVARAVDRNQSALPLVFDMDKQSKSKPRAKKEVVGIYSKIKDWQTGKVLEFVDIINKSEE